MGAVGEDDGVAVSRLGVVVRVDADAGDAPVRGQFAHAREERVEGGQFFFGQEQVGPFAAHDCDCA